MNLNNVSLGLSYDDVLLVPRRSSIRTRKDVSLKTRLSKSIDLSLPIVAAPMDSVCESQMAIAMSKLGGLGIIHRFQPPEVQAQEIHLVKEAGSELLAGFAVGTNEDLKERTKVCMDAKADVLVLDIAHGHADHGIEAIKQIKDSYPDSCIIAGNVATPEGAADLAKAGADCIRIGIGPGGVCTTRQVTGVGVPQMTAIDNIARADVGVPLMADGGIRFSGDIAKALAAGADTVMIGSLLAGTAESPGELEDSPEGPVKRLRGMASKEAAEERAKRHNEELDEEYFEHRAPEGVEGTVPFRGEAAEVIGQLVGGIKSSMSYLDAVNLEAFKKNASFIRITQAGYRESSPHAI